MVPAIILVIHHPRFDYPGKKVPDYWDTAKKLLNDPSKFLDSLMTYDKDNIKESVIQKVEPYIQMDDFTP